MNGTAASTIRVEPRRDRFGNALAPGLPYARGSILASGPDEHTKLKRARSFMEERIARGGEEALFNFSGLERSMTVHADQIYNDETTPALFDSRVTAAALEHLGGDPFRHDVALMNRQSAALFAALMVLVKPGDKVIGVSADYTHPAVTRPVALLGGNFVDTIGIQPFEKALMEQGAQVVVLTRLDVSYRALPIETIERAIELSRSQGALILVDDAGGARVGPAVFGQPRLLEMDIDVGSTGLDKYGTVGPRLGLLAGKKELVAEIRTRAFEYGLEARPMLYPAVLSSLQHYNPQRVLELRECTAKLSAALIGTFGTRVFETAVSTQILGEELLELAMQRAQLEKPPIVPYEATAAIAMLLLRDYGALTVHLAALPPGTSALLFKFVSPETMHRFGGTDKLVRAIDAAIDQLSEMLLDREAIRRLLLG